jgi:hypothetical protein
MITSLLLDNSFFNARISGLKISFVNDENTFFLIDNICYNIAFKNTSVLTQLLSSDSIKTYSITLTLVGLSLSMIVHYERIVIICHLTIKVLFCQTFLMRKSE